MCVSVNYILNLNSILEKSSWKSNFGVICYVPFSFIKSFHLVFISMGLKQEKIQLAVGETEVQISCIV